jgi:hypothetical protein
VEAPSDDLAAAIDAGRRAQRPPGRRVDLPVQIHQSGRLRVDRGESDQDRGQRPVVEHQDGRLSRRIDAVRSAGVIAERSQVPHETRRPAEGMRSARRGARLPHHLLGVVDGERLTGAAAKGAEVAHLAVRPEEGVGLAVGCP